MKGSRALPLVIIAFAMGFSFCSSKKEVEAHNGNMELGLTTSMLGESSVVIQPGSLGESWASDDAIGVFSTTLKANNVRYVANGQGNGTRFTGGVITIPFGIEAHAVRAYAPYNPSATDGAVRVDLSKENNRPLLWAKGTVTNAEPNLALNFTHKLGQLRISLDTSKTSAPSTSAKVSVLDVLTTGVLDVTSGRFTTDSEVASLSLVHRGSEYHTYLMPGQRLDGMRILIEHDGKQYDAKLSSSKSVEGGKYYGYTVSLENGAAVVQAGALVYSTSYMEQVLVQNGSMTDMYVVQHNAPDAWFGGGSTLGGVRRNYTVYFSQDKFQPYIVAYPLYHDCVGNSGRADKVIGNDAWVYDPDVPKRYQMNLSRSYRPRELDFSRGHMLASNQRTASIELNKTTFYYSNMVPQKQSQNSGIWNVLENKENSWAKRANPTDTMYVACGPIFSHNNGTVTDRDGDKQCPIPTHTWKVLLKKKGGKWMSIGVKMPNIDTKSKWSDFTCTVQQLEKELGVKFFPHLPESEAAHVKSLNNSRDW